MPESAQSHTAKPSYYLTTPIYYVNGVPHIGTAYTTIAADALVRFERMDGKDTWFLTGLDEHGQKVAQAAEDAGVSPQEWVDSIAPKFLDAWKLLEISNDDFIRTTEQRHIECVQQIFAKINDNGYLYQGNYKGLYCLPDETFFTDEQLAEFAESAEAAGKPHTDAEGTKLCPDCGRPLIMVEEENLFFKLSEFEQRLLDHYEQNPDFICPEIRRNEVVSFVKSGLKDLSVTRTTFDWGVHIPFAPKHVSYVWVDALINYISAIGYGSPDPADQENFVKRWPAQVHFVGKDIIRFHCVIWPAMLMAAGIELPKKVIAHGFLLTKGEKISKSRGNGMAPDELCEIFGVDGYRYFFLSDVQFGADGTISLERMAQVYNADLANSWGNLCSRAFNMTNKYFGGRVPEVSTEVAARFAADPEVGNPLAELASGIYERYATAFDGIDYSAALAEAMALCDRANLYVEESAPWSLAKVVAGTGGDDGADTAVTTQAQERLAYVIYNILEAIRIMALLFAPVMPLSSAEVYRRLQLEDIFQTDDLKSALKWGALPANNEVTIGQPLFPRLKEEDL